MSANSSSQDESVEKLKDFLLRHYLNFAREDILYSRLRQSIKRLTTDELINGKFYRAHYNVDREIIEQEFRKMKNDYLNKLRKVVYSTSNEPVRLGAFRVLLLEAHTHLLGDLDWKLPKEVLDLAVHGIVQENLYIMNWKGTVEALLHLRNHITQE